MLNRVSPLALLFAAFVLPPACAPASDSELVDGEEPVGDRDDAVGSGSVADAVSSSCATSSVKGLALQIIAEGQCLSPDAYAEVPALSNVTFGPNVYPFLEKPARDHLVTALQAAPSKKISFNSMMRTLPQQYLLYRWYQNGTCGVGLAAKPGSSNHETGLAFDTDDRASWQSTLTANGFQWFGSADPVHFDYVGSGAKDYRGLDVKAFQRLWNRNHPEDPIAEDGDYGPQTEARLRKSPAAGFPIGAECGGSSSSSSSSSSSASSSSGGAASWSCTGSYGTTKMADGQYYGTAFGCWSDSQGGTHQDPGDNCVPTCLSQAKSSGLCAGMSGPVCEETVEWFAADAARFGCLTRLKVTNAKNGKAVVVVALDYGPSCTVEKSVSHAVIDLSYPANQYLFGSAMGAVDKALVHVDEVDASTPLGPAN